MYNYKGKWIDGILDKMLVEIQKQELEYANRPLLTKIKWWFKEEWIKFLYKIKWKLDSYLLNEPRKKDYVVTIRKRYL